MTSEQELNEKLAKWAGFTYYDNPIVFGPSQQRTGWYFPGGRKVHILPDFTTDLNACFKWLVPPLTHSKISSFDFNYSDGSVTAVLYDKSEWLLAQSTENWTNPALALCKAIEQLIDAGAKACGENP